MQLDIKAAYLNAPLDKNIYVNIPPGDGNFGKGYWLLHKALYGLKTIRPTMEYCFFLLIFLKIIIFLS